MKLRLVFVHNPQETAWHRAEIREPSNVPLRKALCGAMAETLSASESYESWAHQWHRAIDPPGSGFCARCDELALAIDPQRFPPSTPAAKLASVESLLTSVFGADGPGL